MNKEEVRYHARRKREALSVEWIEKNSRYIQNKIINMPEFITAGIVCCYLPFTHEVRTDRVIDKCYQSGKLVCVPAFSPDNGFYRLAALEKGARLIPGPLNIPEPDVKKWVTPAELDFVVVPGIAFDFFCARLGHGGGHYDRILAETKSSCFKLGIAFTCQLFERVPTSCNDIGMDMVITETEIIKKH